MVGRDEEIKELERLYHSEKPELVTIYGRCRVGKTYLIDTVMAGRLTFRHTGLSPYEEADTGQLRAQLLNFHHSLYQQGADVEGVPEDWMSAFFALENHLDAIDDGRRQVVFLDELPWMDTPRSGFIRAFEAFWNNWGCHRNNLMVIICGSASSWILDKLIDNHGGLYNRVTYEIKLSPFTLKECEDFLKECNIPLSRYDIMQAYMMLGGIPYYLSYLGEGKSLAQSIDKMFFSRKAKLAFEYDRLFASVFAHPRMMRQVAELLYTRNAGYTRTEIEQKLKYSGGALSDCLNALIACDFVMKYVPFGFSKRQVHYKLVDPFCMFHLRFVEGRSSLDKDFWQQNVSSQSVISWRGFAYENLCFHHIDVIKAALGISGVATTQSAWTKRADDTEGTQIDLLIERGDNVINLCEMKFYSDEFTVDKAYYRTMLHRQTILAESIPKKYSICNTLITTFGLKRNEYSGVFANVITAEELFR